MSNLQIEDWLNDFYNLNPDAVNAEEEKPKKKASTLMLVDELSAMDLRNMNFYKNLSDEHKKEINLWTLMRYMSSSQNSSEHHILMVNDLVNCNFNLVRKHPELQWKLLALCGTGKKQFHKWLGVPKGIKKNKLEDAVLQHKPFLNDDELEIFMKINTTDDLIVFFKDYGYDDKTISELLDATKK